jgi:hypothetical protein
MRFEKKEPDIRIQPFNKNKNPWSRCICIDCAVPYAIEHGTYLDEGGGMTVAWHGQNTKGDYLWQCAKCLAEDKQKRKQ